MSHSHGQPGFGHSGHDREGSTPHPHRPAIVRPEHAIDAVLTFEVLSFELSGLLDLTSRGLELACATLPGGGAFAPGEGERLARELERTRCGVEHTGELLKSAMWSAPSVIGSPTLNPRATLMLDACLGHAVSVLAPMAREARVDVTVDIASDLRAVPMGPTYAAVLAALRNAIEASGRAGGGHVELSAHVRDDLVHAAGGALRPARTLLLEIRDDGAGPARGVDSERFFEPGFTTKPRGAGLGLAVCRSVIDELGGTVELRAREAFAPGRRRGATLRITCPMAVLCAGTQHEGT